MTDGIAAFGTQLQIGDGGSPTEAFTTIAELLDISGPELSTDTEDATNHGSTDAYEEVIATILRTGNVGFDVNWVPAGATHGYTSGLLKDWEEKTSRNFKLIFPDSGSTTWTFTAIVTGISPAMPVAGKLTGSITLKVTGSMGLA